MSVDCSAMHEHCGSAVVVCLMHIAAVITDAVMYAAFTCTIKGTATSFIHSSLFAQKFQYNNTEQKKSLIFTT